METPYAYGGARALVHLHAHHLAAFVGTWREAVEAGVEMPPTEDPDCASLEAVLRHVLGAARGYMVWVCEVMALDDPGIEPVPDDVAGGLDDYVAHLRDRWDRPLREVGQKEMDRPVYPSRWGTPYCVDAMLEHAVMHAIRHRLQLERILEAP